MSIDPQKLLEQWKKFGKISLEQGRMTFRIPEMGIFWPHSHSTDPIEHAQVVMQNAGEWDNARALVDHFNLIPELCQRLIILEPEYIHMPNVKSYDFIGELEDRESAYLTDTWVDESQHIILTHEDEEARITALGGGEVQICRDHFERIGQLMGWIK